MLLVLAGDFLSPSVASSVFKGEQMVAALNAAGLDLATLGNHEFDFGRDVLLQRMAEAKFQWVVSNVVDTKTGKPIGGAAPYVLRDAGPLKVGFIGLCIKTPLIKDNQAGIRFTDPLLAAARYIPILKRRGANVIVAITHLAFAEDRALVRRFPEIDLVIGGHEHYPITASENHALISKAGSEAKWAARIDINRTPTGTVERFYELIPITSAIADDPQAAQAVALYESRLGKELDEVVGTSTVGLDATDLGGVSEANLGNLFADALRADVSADVGLINAGAIRGDRLYPAGPLTRRTLIAMHPFGNVNCEIAVTGRVLLAALNSGVSKLPTGAGQFPQVSGLTMKVNPRGPPGNRVTGVLVNGQPLDPDKTYTLALPDYVLKGGDSYTMFCKRARAGGARVGESDGRRAREVRRGEARRYRRASKAESRLSDQPAEPEQPHRVLFQNQRPHVILDTDLLEIRQPAIRRQQRVVRPEQHLCFEQRVGVLNQRRREILRRPAGEIDVHLRLVQADGNRFVLPRERRVRHDDGHLRKIHGDIVDRHGSSELHREGAA